MAHGVDPEMHNMQPSSSQSLGDCSFAEADRSELSPRDHAVLARRHRRNLLVSTSKGESRLHISLDSPFDGVGRRFG